MPRLVIKAPDGEVSYLELGSNPVLVGREGYNNNVLKIRPPMVFKPDNADTLIKALDEVIAEL